MRACVALLHQANRCRPPPWQQPIIHQTCWMRRQRHVPAYASGAFGAFGAFGAGAAAGASAGASEAPAQPQQLTFPQHPLQR